jgi:hypothetical protein
MCLLFRCNACLCGMTRCEQGLLARQLACEGFLEVFQLGEWARVPTLDAQCEVLLLRAQAEILTPLHPSPLRNQ